MIAIFCRTFVLKYEDFLYIFFFIKESKHDTIFTSNNNDKLQKLRDKLQYLFLV